MCASVYVCVSVYVFVYVYVYVYAYIYICVIYVYVCLYVYVYVYLHTCNVTVSVPCPRFGVFSWDFLCFTVFVTVSLFFVLQNVPSKTQFFFEAAPLFYLRNNVFMCLCMYLLSSLCIYLFWVFVLLYIWPLWII